MSRWLAVAIAIELATSACGRLGPPRRSHPTPAPAAASTPALPAALPTLVPGEPAPPEAADDPSAPKKENPQ